MSNAFLPNPWNDPANVETLTTLWGEGWSSGQIAKRLGLTRNCVIGKVYRLGLKRNEAAQLNLRQLAGHGLHKPARVMRPKAVKRPKPEPARKVVGGPPAAAIIRRAEAKPIPLPEPQEAPVSLLHAKPWTERQFGECTWPVSGEGADLHSCCAKVFKRNWCRAHFLRGTEPMRESPARYAARHRWAA